MKVSKKPSTAYVVALILCCLVGFGLPLGAQGPGEAAGSLLANGKKVALSHAYLIEEPEGFYDPADPTWTLIFTAEPMDAKALEHPMISPSAHIGITLTSEFSDGGPPELQVLSQSLRTDDFSMSGGDYPDLVVKEQTPDSFIGQLRHEKENEFFDKTYQIDLTFHAKPPAAAPPFGTPLPSDGGEPGKAYRAWTEALHKTDLDALRKLVPAEMAAMLDEPDAADSIKDMASMMPKNITIESGRSDGETAIFQVKGTMDGEPVKGEVTMSLQDGFWMLTGFSME